MLIVHVSMKTEFWLMKTFFPSLRHVKPLYANCELLAGTCRRYIPDIVSVVHIDRRFEQRQVFE